MKEAFPDNTQRKIKQKETQNTHCPDDSDVPSLGDGSDSEPEGGDQFEDESDDEWVNKPEYAVEPEEPLSTDLPGEFKSDEEEDEDEEWVWKLEYDCPPPEPIVPPPPMLDSSEGERIVRERRGKKKLRTKKNKLKTEVGPPTPEHFLTHFRKHPECPVCRECKTPNPQRRAKKNKKKQKVLLSIPEAEHFGNHFLADHKVLNPDDASRHGDVNSLNMIDRATYWSQSFANKTRDKDGVIRFIGRFAGPRTKIYYMYTDNAKDFQAATKEIKITWDPSTAYIGATNGIMERCNRRMNEGTSFNLVQSGFTHEWWPETQDRFNFVWNVTERKRGKITI